MDTHKLIKSFNDIAKFHEDFNTEFWYARDLMEVLGYKRWENFINVINKTITSIETSNINPSDHIREVTKMVKLGSGAERATTDFMITRYGCYILAMNADSSKEEISFAQGYFAVQTRKQEIIEERIDFIERAKARERLKSSEKRLSQNIYERGVDDSGFARIRSKGDAALFGGITTQGMKNKLDISKTRALADFLPTLTIAAKNLATEMTNFNVEEKNLIGEEKITGEHIQNNKSVRNMLGDRGIKPEDLPKSEDYKKIERKIKSEEKKMINDTLSEK